MATGYSINGVDIEQYFDPLVSTKRTNIGFFVGSSDITNLFEPLNNDQQIPDTGVYISGTTDLSRIFRGHPAQYTTDVAFTGIRTTSWVNQVIATVKYTFSSTTAMTNFFTYGGRLRVAASRTGGTASSKNTSWTNLLNGMGTVELGKTKTYQNVNSAVVRTFGADSLTASWQNIYDISSSSYSANRLRVQAYKPSATQVTMRIICTDGIDNVVDEPVNGSLTAVFSTRYHPTQANPTAATTNWTGS